MSFSVRVSTSDNQSFDIGGLNDGTTVAQFKARIESHDRFRYPAARQQLSHRGETLANQETLLYYHITQGSVIQLQMAAQ